MKRTLRTLLALFLALILSVGSVAFADNNADGSGEDSGEIDNAGRADAYYWDHLARFFRFLPEGLRVLLERDGYADISTPVSSPEATPEASPEATPEAVADDPLLSEEELAGAAQILAGCIIGLDPGHQNEADYGLEAISPGSPSTKIRQSVGCSGVRTRVPEHRINLLVAQKVRALLEECGATVVMTRTGAEASLSNIERAQMMNQSGAAFWLRIHCNASKDAAVSGASVLVPSHTVTPAIYEQSLRLGESLGAAFGEATDAPAASLVSLENQTGFNWSELPVAALEMGHLTNAADDALLGSDAYQMRCAVGIFNGIVRYLAAEGSAAQHAAVQPEGAEPEIGQNGGEQ